MASLTYAEPGKTRRAAFSPTITSTLSRQVLWPKSNSGDRETAPFSSRHSFADVRVESGRSFRQSCPLALPSPTLCPFGGACHTCPLKVHPSSTDGKPTGFASPFKSGKPAKALGLGFEGGDREKPSPMQGGATIQCDGAGSYEIVYNGWAGAACGTRNCVTAHENSHIADWQAKWPTGCVGQAKGYLPKGDPPDNPLMTAAEYKAFLKKSECKAHTVDLNCAKALPKPAGCEKTVDDYIDLTEKQRRKWCPSSLGWLVGGLGGAAAGALIGGLAGGPLGALIGAGIGALAGGITGAFF
jgi:hypothetical protein